MIVFLIGTVFGVFVGLVLLALVRFVRRGHHIAETFSPEVPADTGPFYRPMLAGEELSARVRDFRPGATIVWECLCDHKLTDTGGVFYQSVGLLECVRCGGWQAIRKGIK